LKTKILTVLSFQEKVDGLDFYNTYLAMKKCLHFSKITDDVLQSKGNIKFGSSIDDGNCVGAYTQHRIKIVIFLLTEASVSSKGIM
jgi:hypothetical protein